ncbi:hypothetical protein P7C73_g2372, partial [Tremellales sp. Uapishka_1]
MSSPSVRPSLSRSNSSYGGMGRQGLDRYGEDWGGGAMTLLDVLETFFDSRLDLFERRLKAQSARLKSRAVELIPKGLRTPKGGGILFLDEDLEDSSRESKKEPERSWSGDKYKREVEKEVDRFKVKVGIPFTPSSVDIIWQGAYYKVITSCSDPIPRSLLIVNQFISVDRKVKVESGQRQTSFRYMLNDKHGPVGKALQGIKPEHRELWFIFGQLIYSIIFMIPPATLFIRNATASSVFLITIFSVSVWNGGTFYVEVFGRKFERELEKLRKEMDAASASTVSTNSVASTVPATPDDSHSPFVDVASPDKQPIAAAVSPLMLPKTGESSNDLAELALDAGETKKDA